MQYVLSKNKNNTIAFRVNFKRILENILRELGLIANKSLHQGRGQDFPDGWGQPPPWGGVEEPKATTKITGWWKDGKRKNFRHFWIHCFNIMHCCI